MVLLIEGFCTLIPETKAATSLQKGNQEAFFICPLARKKEFSFIWCLPDTKHMIMIQGLFYENKNAESTEIKY